MLNNRQEYERMARAEGTLWWYRTLHQLVRGALAKHARGQDIRLVDVGCGTGGLLAFLQARGYHHLAGLDISPHALAWCRERGLSVAQGDLRRLGSLFAPASEDVVVCNDVLYFFTLAEQVEIIGQCRTILAPGGLLVINVPAGLGFRGIHDLSVGIQRRFTRRDIPRLVPPAQFELVQARFWPFWLSPAIFAVRLSQRWRLKWSPSLTVQSDVHPLPAWINGLCETITRLENAILPWKPFGSSLFLVGRKI